MGRVGRFQVMAMLQAARAEALGLDPDAARSWGLNRAIFYAAAKRGFRRAGPPAPAPPPGAPPGRRAAPAVEEREYSLGNEKAYLAGDQGRGLRFAIGDEVQTPADFEQQVQGRFSDWGAAWSEALEIVGTADPAALESQRRFFEEIYRPLRDTLARRWSDDGKRG